MKSQAQMRPPWLWRNVAQVWPPPQWFRTPRMYFWMVRLLTGMPSLRSSPRMRSAPHRRPRRAMSRMRSMVSFGSGDDRRGRDQRRQKSRKPARCQRISVSGWTTTIAVRQPSRSRAPRRSLRRSKRLSLGRLLLRRRMPKPVAKDRVLDEEVASRAAQICGGRGDVGGVPKRAQGRQCPLEHAPRPCGDAGLSRRASYLRSTTA